MRRGVYWRLSAMMFLQYAIWGAWSPVLFPFLDGAGMTGKMIGVVYCLLPFGCMISPITGGQLADRYIPTQWLLVAANLIGAALLWVMGSVLNLQDMASPMQAFWAFGAVMLVYSLIYGPTVPLTNSISFEHLKDIERQFGSVRVWGTIGWIAAGAMLTAWRFETAAIADPESVNEAAHWFLATLQTAGHYVGAPMVKLLGNAHPSGSDCLVLAGAFSVLAAIFCALLPHTPPKREGVEPLAFVKAFRLLRQPNFLAYMIISFIVITELWFYYLLTAQFLKDPIIGIDSAVVPLTMTLAQIGEIFTMAILLPILLPRLGVRLCLALGVIAWPIRYAVFAFWHAQAPVVAALPLHGFCYVFFFVVGQIYVDNEAPRDIRASAQALWAVFVLGIGSIVGSYFAGWIKDVFTTGEGAAAVTNWTAVFVVPMVLTILCALAFLIFFREPEKKQHAPSSAG